MSDTIFLKYIPHGINSKQFFKPTTEADLKRVAEVRKTLFGEDHVDFVVTYNNRNIRRKMTGDVVLAYQRFLQTLPAEKRPYCRLVLHTQPVDDNGTDLPTLIRDIAPDIQVAFSSARVDTPTLNAIYANSDVVINLASNEGFGLGTMEAIMAEKMVIVNVTGGLQDQCGFKNEDGQYLHEDFEYCKEWGTNADARYENHGEWVVPVFPNNRALIGSPPTPYIFDDRCSWEHAATAIRTVYDLTPEERAARGVKGREYAMTQGFNADEMCNRFIAGIETVFNKWKPRRRFDLVKG